MYLTDQNFNYLLGYQLAVEKVRLFPWEEGGVGLKSI